MRELLTKNVGTKFPEEEEEEEKKSPNESMNISLKKLTSVDQTLMSDYQKLLLMAQTERRNSLNYGRSLSIYQKIIVSVPPSLL